MAKALCQALYLDTRSTVALIGLRKTKPETGNIEPPDVLFQMVDKLRYVSNRWWGGGGGAWFGSQRFEAYPGRSR